MYKLPDQDELLFVAVGPDKDTTSGDAVEYIEWTKPVGAKLCFITIQAPGGAGGNGGASALSTAAGGGGGGGGGGHISAVIPAFALPDKLYCIIPAPNNATANARRTGLGLPILRTTSLSAFTRHCIPPFAVAGAPGSNGTTSGGTAGSAGSTTANVATSNLFILTAASPSASSAGTANAGSTAITHSSQASGGSGGTGVNATNSTASSTPGGINFSAASVFGNISSPGTGGGVQGNNGHNFFFNPMFPICHTGGTGGAGNTGASSVGGKGGDGGFGCGGGGGGGANGASATGGVGGKGGRGYIIIQTLV